MIFALAFVVAYLVGAFPTAYVVGRLRNIDITKEGSGNVGGTNALRVLGIGPGITVAVTDFLKAIIPTYVALHVLGLPLWQALAVAAAAIVGHNWSVYIGFKGGKGIACTIGVSAVLFPGVLLASLVIAAFSVVVTRYVSLGSLLLTALMPIILFYNRHPQEYIWFAVFLMIFATHRHRSNIERLLNGTERKIGKK
ncbi:MAG: glycerol-3-phosphate 1-O-acyltransferase PlsY [Peptococcaceae bacterium]|nr:glycerol-3-phosphate 1-O-acyltransferase PlsY [Peptococcaceae bacterium]